MSDPFKYWVTSLFKFGGEGQGGRGEGKEARKGGKGRKGEGKGKGRKREREEKEGRSPCAPVSSTYKARKLSSSRAQGSDLLSPLGREVAGSLSVGRLPGPSVGGEGANPRYQEMPGDERPELSGTQEEVSDLGGVV